MPGAAALCYARGMQHFLIDVWGLARWTFRHLRAGFCHHRGTVSKGVIKIAGTPHAVTVCPRCKAELASTGTERRVIAVG